MFGAITEPCLIKPMLQLLQMLLHQLVSMTNNQVVVHIITVTPIEFFHGADVLAITDALVALENSFCLRFCEIMVDTYEVCMIDEIIHAIYTMPIFVDCKFSCLICGKMSGVHRYGQVWVDNGLYVSIPFPREFRPLITVGGTVYEVVEHTTDGWPVFPS